MARLRTSFSNYEELADAWIERWRAGIQAGGHGLSTGGPMPRYRAFFEADRPDVIWSYGKHWPIARLMKRADWKEFALIKECKTWRTTQTQTSDVKGCLRRLGIEWAEVSDPFETYESALRLEWEQKIDAELKALRRKRKEWAITHFERVADEAIGIRAFFDFGFEIYPFDYDAIRDTISRREHSDQVSRTNDPRPKSGFALKGREREERLRMHERILALAEEFQGGEKKDKILALPLVVKIHIDKHPLPESALVIALHSKTGCRELLQSEIETEVCA